MFLSRVHFQLLRAASVTACLLLNLSTVEIQAQQPEPKPVEPKAISKRPLTAKVETPKRPPLPPMDAATKLAIDKKIIAEAKDHSEVMANLGYISDVIGARLTGSESLKRANEWTAEKFKSYGLEGVKLEAWTIPAAWERGFANARLLEPKTGQLLTVASMGWSPGTNGKVVGDVVIFTPENEAGLKKYEGKLKNAIVLRGPPSTVRPLNDSTTGYEARIPGAGAQGGPNGRGRGDGKGARKAEPEVTGEPKAAKKSESLSDAKSKEEKQGKSEKGDRRGFRPERSMFRMMQFSPVATEFLKKQGAAVVLSDSQKPHGMLNMGGAWRGPDRASASEPLPALFITHDHYAMLYRLASRKEPAKTRVEIEVSNKTIPGPIAVYNTVCEIKGSERPDEFVVIGAHLDSWDLASGTTDNGTGSSVVLEAARLISKCGTKPRRTIRFVLFTGEEQGLHGSRAYVQQHADEMPRTSMCLVHDTGTGRVLKIGLQGRQPIKPILDAELASIFELGVQEINMGFLVGTDHQSFERVNVPGFAFQQDPAEYRFTHHSQTDTFDKAREADLIQGSQVMAIVAMRVANLPEMLPRSRD